MDFFLKLMEPEPNSIQHLNQVEQRLRKYKTKQDLKRNLDQLCQILVYADQNQREDLFVCFIEQKIHLLLLDLLKQEETVVYGLVFFNMFLESVNTGSILYFVLSNNYINQLIDLKISLEEDALFTYVSLLKNLSQKVNLTTIHLFFPDNKAFPLYSHAVLHFNSHEPMVRIAVRNLVLNILQLNIPQCTNYIIRERNFFQNMTTYINNCVQS
ncbi:hypothetical protein EDD86DRAFT_215186, partial [Gorgonomyces haynaldii]